MVWTRYCLRSSLQELLSLFRSAQSATQRQVSKTKHLLGRARGVQTPANFRLQPAAAFPLLVFPSAPFTCIVSTLVLSTCLFPAAERPLITACRLISKQGIFIPMDVFTRSQNNSDGEPFVQKAQQTRRLAFEM